MSVTVRREDVSAYLRRFSVISSVLETPADSVQLLPELLLLYCTHIWTQFNQIRPLKLMFWGVTERTIVDAGFCCQVSRTPTVSATNTTSSLMWWRRSDLLLFTLNFTASKNKTTRTPQTPNVWKEAQDNTLRASTIIIAPCWSFLNKGYSDHWECMSHLEHLHLFSAG